MTPDGGVNVAVNLNKEPVAVKNSIDILATGDTILNRRLRDDGDACAGLTRLVRAADVAFTNLELTTPPEPLMPWAESQGMHLQARPWVLDELHDLGFNLYNLANNHAIDYTLAGIQGTMRELEARGLTYAGAGGDLAAARAAAYLETTAGRVALIGVTSSFPVGAQAGPAGNDMGGRPGINPLRYETRYVLDERRIAHLREIDEVLGTAAVLRRWLDAGFDYQVPQGAYPFLRFLGDPLHFHAGDTPGVRTFCHAQDLADIQRAVSAAKRQADLVLVSFHAHEGQSGDINCLDAADFVNEAAHAWIDAGADVVIGHGPHVVRPIELYRGKPIFYSLGNFMFMPSTVDRFPAEMYQRHRLPANATAADLHDALSRHADGTPKGFHADSRYWTSFVPVCHFEGPDLVSIDLHPITLTRAPRAHEGTPRLADAEEGQKMLTFLGEISKQFGTDIQSRKSGNHVIGHISMQPE